MVLPNCPIGHGVLSAATPPHGNGLFATLARTNYPKLGKEVASRIPHVRLIDFPDLGHSPQIQAPEVFHKVLLDWLEAAQN
jgi:pimeloyl-ACP methyl ester carboxylesterase